MNIQAISPYSYVNTRVNENRTKTNLHMAAPLARDTVSFTSKEKLIRHTSQPVLDAIGKAYDDKTAKMQIKGKRFMGTLSAIANKVEGVIFDEEYCSGAIVKSKKSFLSKLKRSGKTAQDQMRSTLYIKDLHDFSKISKVLEELKDVGYDIKMIPNEVVGKKVKSRKPDFDIRLDNVQESELLKLPEHLRGCVSHRQQSGYGDIQMRLIDTLDKSKDKTPIELIVLYGKETAKAKHLESEHVYNITRVLKNELHISNSDMSNIHSPARKAKQSIDAVTDILNGSISKPLFRNAENIDVFDGTGQMVPVGLSKENCESIDMLMGGNLRDLIEQHYRVELSKAKKLNDTELTKYVQESEEYFERQDKTIYAKDLIEAKKAIIQRIKQEKKEDVDNYNQVMEALKETIRIYRKK